MTGMATKQIYSLPVRQLAPIGAEVDIDLSIPLSNVQQDEFREIVYNHEVVVFRNQQLTMEQQVRVMEILGPTLKSGEGKSYLSLDDGVIGREPLGFHSDWYFLPIPMDAVSLHALEIDGESWTSFLSATRAWQNMPDSLKQKVSGLKVVNVDFMRPPSVPYNVPAGAVSHAHNIPLLHPITGKPVPYIIDGYSAHIEGLEPEDSAATMAEIVSYLRAPDNVYKHIWRNGDLVIWDNMATQHARPNLTGVNKRRLQRVANGRATIREQAPNWTGLEY